MSHILPKIDDYINYNEDVGPLQLLSTGYPGSGKSNHSIATIVKCMRLEHSGKKEMLLTHGDNCCEWRHFLRYKATKDILVLVPNNVNIEYIYENSNNKYIHQFKTQKIDYSKLQIMDYMKPGQVTVVYDDHFSDEMKAILWGIIWFQLVTRKKLYNYTITYLCHEVGNLFPQTAYDDQWRAVNFASAMFVKLRKRLVRAYLVTQVETEIFDRVRKKCYFRIYRDAFPTGAYHRKIVKNRILTTTIETYHLFKGMKYRPDNKNPKADEIKDMWLMIPERFIETFIHPDLPLSIKKRKKNKNLINVNTDKSFNTAIENTYYKNDCKINKTSEYLGIDPRTVSKRLKEIGVIET